MAEQDYAPVISQENTAETKKRSALGIGVTTLVTIMVVLLLTAFAVLSLVSAQTNHQLAEMTAQQSQQYYAAESEATVWYAELDKVAAGLTGNKDEFASQLGQAGYDAHLTSEGELRVTQGFTIDDKRMLMVTITVNDDRTTTIRQWQS